MKILLFLILATSPLFAEVDYNCSLYMKLGGGVTTSGGSDSFVIGGIGRRASCGVWGLDLSAQWGERYWAAPRIVLFRYLATCTGPRPYVGGGVSYGKVDAFHGLMVEGGAGVEWLFVKGRVLFLELGMSQPVLSSHSHPSESFAPAFMLTLSAGL